MTILNIHQKDCPECKELRPAKSFGSRKAPYAICAPCRTARNGIHTIPRDMRINQYLLKTYGISFREYRFLLRKQRNRCAICKAHFPNIDMHNEGAKYPLCVDHDHVTGNVRGLLCNGCNSGLGMFKENPAALQAAIEYLEQAVKNPHIFI